jgi:hypothetical protein
VLRYEADEGFLGSKSQRSTRPSKCLLKKQAFTALQCRISLSRDSAVFPSSPSPRVGGQGDSVRRKETSRSRRRPPRSRVIVPARPFPVLGPIHPARFDRVQKESMKLPAFLHHTGPTSKLDSLRSRRGGRTRQLKKKKGPTIPNVAGVTCPQIIPRHPSNGTKSRRVSALPAYPRHEYCQRRVHDLVGRFRGG